MKPNYKNWMPKGMIWSFAAATAVALALTLIVSIGWLKILLFILTLVLAGVTVWYDDPERELSFDMVKCPYQENCTAAGRPDALQGSSMFQLCPRMWKLLNGNGKCKDYMLSDNSHFLRLDDCWILL